MTALFNPIHALLTSVFGFSVAQWLSLWGGYLAAAGAVVVGGYLLLFAVDGTRLFRLRRYAGFVLVAAGVAGAALTFGRATGAADCMAAWRAKDYEARLAALAREVAAQKAAANSATQKLQELAGEHDGMQRQVDDYSEAAKKLAADLIECRRATDDDDRRMCDITGNAAPGCRHSR
jgi:hypothetical protein